MAPKRITTSAGPGLGAALWGGAKLARRVAVGAFRGCQAHPEVCRALTGRAAWWGSVALLHLALWATWGSHGTGPQAETATAAHGVGLVLALVTTALAKQSLGFVRLGYLVTALHAANWWALIVAAMP